MCISVPVSITHIIVVTEKRICVCVCVCVCVCERERERELLSISGIHLRWSGLTLGGRGVLWWDEEVLWYLRLLGMIEESPLLV